MRTAQDQGTALSTLQILYLSQPWLRAPESLRLRLRVYRGDGPGTQLVSLYADSASLSDLKAIQSIISEDIRSRKSKVVGFGLVEETQFDQLPNEYEPFIQSSVDIMKPETSGLQSSSRNRGLGLQNVSRDSRPRSQFEDLIKGSVTISSQNVSNVTKTRSDEDSLAESFTALKNALRDDKK